MTSSLQLGAASVTRIVEAEGPLLDPHELYPDYHATAIAGDRQWLEARFLDPSSGLLNMAMQGFLVRQGGKTILVDTCVGDCKPRARPGFDKQRWQWLDKLRAFVTPEQVDIVLCTHFHVDHVGWNTCLDEDGHWRPTFPNARYLFTAPELTFWQGERGTAMLPRTGDYVADSVWPVIEAGLADIVPTDHRVADGITLLPTPGHSPGHVCVDIGCGADRLILAGDALHTVLQCRFPHWSTRFCSHPDEARTTRLAFMAEHAAAGTLLAPAHFPTPSWGRLVVEGDHYRFVFLGDDEAGSTSAPASSAAA
jgi:glyoxylase-like metal-dependent hydrolase (beta-lactamase superfamily II)